MLADIASGETGIADLLFLIATILFFLGAVVAFQAKAMWAAIVAGGLGCCSLAWLLL